MSELEALKSELDELIGPRAYIRRWVGLRPTSDPQRIPHELAETIGYRRPTQRDGSDTPFLEIDRHLAAVTLAMLATQSQAYEFNRAPPAELVEAFEGVLSALGDQAQFFSNADHSVPWTKLEPPLKGGDPEHPLEIGAMRCVDHLFRLSDATFDTGVIGLGEKFALIRWADEDD